MTRAAWAIIGPYLPGYLPDNPPGIVTGTARDAVAALIDETDFQCEHDECPRDDDDTAECAPCSDVAFAESARADMVASLERSGRVAFSIESYANGFGGIVEVERAEPCAMDVYQTRIGTAAAECPMCGAVCVYWDAEDLSDAGELMCWHEHPRQD